jgi:hypothetical protein
MKINNFSKINSTLYPKMSCHEELVCKWLGERLAKFK